MTKITIEIPDMSADDREYIAEVIASVVAGSSTLNAEMRARGVKCFEVIDQENTEFAVAVTVGFPAFAEMVQR